MIHTPVLLQETLDALQIGQGKRYIDATFGLGGHAYEIAARGGKVLAIDFDENTVKKNFSEAGQHAVLLVNGNYADIKTIAEKYQFVPCAGILFDLGLSMEQIRGGKRGFSYKQESDILDMRINQKLEKTASLIVTSYSEQELYETLVLGAEELNSRAIVSAIVRARRIRPIKTVKDLNSAIEEAVKVRGQQLEKILRRVYQALFIEVNQEFDNLKKGLYGACECIDKQGKIVVISFHAGHERIVKRFAKEKQLVMRVVRGKRNQISYFERSATIRILSRYE